MRDIHDHYFHQAKRDGYSSRAAYKLIEIDDRRKLLKPGDAVLDCGCAPGSWLQVAAERVGPTGIVVGIDLQPVMVPSRLDNIRVLQADLNEIAPEELLKLAGRSTFRVVLSDMAPGTTGDPRGDHFLSARLCDRVLELVPDVLGSGGHCVMKVFEGERYPELLESARGFFKKVKGFKPRASRSASVEMYIIAEEFRGPTQDAGATTADPNTRARKKPSGWS